MKKLNFLSILLSALLVSGSMWGQMPMPKPMPQPEEVRPLNELTEHPIEHVKKAPACKIAMKNTASMLQMPALSLSRKVAMEETCEAQIGDSCFATFAAALDSAMRAETEQTIVLKADVFVDDHIIVSKPVTINADTFYLYLYQSNLQISADVKFTASGNSSYVANLIADTAKVLDNGKLTIQGAANIGSQIQLNGGDVSMEGTSCMYNTAYAFHINSSASTYTNNRSMTWIEKIYVTKTPSAGKGIINNDYLICNLTSNEGIDPSIANSQGGTLHVYDADIAGTLTLSNSGDIYAMMGTYGKISSAPQFTSGYFSKSAFRAFSDAMPSTHMGYFVYKSNVSDDIIVEIAEKGAYGVEAILNETDYYTLFGNAKYDAVNGDKIALNSNIVLSSGTSMPGITLDLKSYNITFKNTAWDGDVSYVTDNGYYGIYAYSDTLKIKGTTGKIIFPQKQKNKSTAYYGFYNSANLKLESGSVEGNEDYTILSYGNVTMNEGNVYGGISDFSTGKVEINGGLVKSRYAIYHSAPGGKVEINDDAKIEGAITMCGGTLTINNGSISNIETGSTIQTIGGYSTNVIINNGTISNNNSGENSYAIYSDATVDQPISITINGGKISALKKLILANKNSYINDVVIKGGEFYKPANGTMFEGTSHFYIIGGWFNSCNEAELGAELENNYFFAKANPAKENMYEVIPAIAVNNGWGYSSLASAIDDANVGDNIVLIRDTTESVTSTKDLTFNLKKHSLGGLTADNAIVSVNAQIENNVTSITSFGATNGGQLKILGGTYLNSVADSTTLATTYVPEGYKIACISKAEPIKWGVSNGYVAKINTTDFITLDAAISAVTDSINSGTATEIGKVIKLLQDVSISSAAALPNGATLDLNSKTLMVDEKDACVKLAAAEGVVIVKNGILSNTGAIKSADCVVLLDKKGTIQLQDVDVVAAGKYGIMSTAADAVINLDAACSISGAKSAPIYASAATKVINAATFDKVSFGDVAMNIENSGTISMIETSASSKAFTLVNNGEATLFAGAFTGAVTLTNNAGATLNVMDTVDVNYMTTSFTNATIANAGTLNLKNGNFMTSSSISSTGTMNITGGQYVNAVYNQIKNSINTGSYDALASVNAKKENAYIVVAKGTESVAKMTVGETVKYFTSVQDAFNNLPENSTPATVTLMSDASINYEGHCIKLQKYHNVTLDLNGHSIYGATNVTGSSSIFENFGTLTIVGDPAGAKEGGAIYNIETNPEDYVSKGKPFPSYAYNIFTNHGLLVINGGFFENQTNSNSSYIVDNQSNGYAYTPNLVVNGGHMLNNHTNCIRMFVNTDSTTLINKVTVNGGTIEGYCAIWGQLLNSKSPGEIYINGGKFITTSKKYNPAIYGSLKQSDTQIYFTGSNQYAKCIITGGEFDENFWIGSKVDYKISGGRFNGAIETYSDLTALSGGIYDFNNDYKGHSHINDKPTLEGYVVEGYCMVHIGDSATDYMYEVKPCGGIVTDTINKGGNWNDPHTWARVDTVSGSGVPTQGDIVLVAGNGQPKTQEDTVRVVVPTGVVAEANTVTVTGEGQIVVKDGATLKIGDGGIVTDNEELLPIIVEAGGVLTVGTGGVDQVEGTLTPVTITHDEEKSGVFMVDPNATTELAEAPATVNVYTRSYMTNSLNHWQQFASPVKGHIKITPLGVGQLDGVQSEIYNWDYATDKWLWMKTFTKTGWEGDNILLPFEAYDLINNSLPEEGGITYQFEGSLCGNNDMILNFPEHGYCIFGNSYTAPIDLNTLFEKVINDMPQENVDPCVYVFNSVADRFESVNSLDLFLKEFGIEPAFTSISPQQAFVMNLRDGNSAQTSVDYNKSVWGNTNTTKTDPIRAPRRLTDASINLSAYLDIRVSDGISTDKLVLVEGEAYDNTYNAGADAEKYMNSKLNLYANTEAGKLGMVATDNIVGTMLTLETGKNIQYTMTFAHVYGDFVLIDHETNKITSIQEGGTYNFVASANSKLADRFEIGVDRKLPTAIEESAASTKAEGVYTVLGQYVGKVADWDMLPTGVYVIDGVKVVK